MKFIFKIYFNNIHSHSETFWEIGVRLSFLITQVQKDASIIFTIILKSTNTLQQFLLHQNYGVLTLIKVKLLIKMDRDVTNSIINLLNYPPIQMSQ